MAGSWSAIVVAVVLFFGFAQPAAAQGVGQGYVYGGPMAFPFTSGYPAGLATFGGGMDALTRNGAGASLEAGLIGLKDLWTGQVTVNAMYEKRLDRAHARPFISGGLTLFGATQAINVGAGANIWGRGRTAVRLDVRDYVFPAAGGMQAIAFRVGMTFR